MNRKFLGSEDDLSSEGIETTSPKCKNAGLILRSEDDLSSEGIETPAWTSCEHWIRRMKNG